MAYGKTLEEIKAAVAAEECGLHRTATPMVTAFVPVEVAEEKPKKASRSRAAKKSKK